MHIQIHNLLKWHDMKDGKKNLKNQAIQAVD